MYIVCVHVYVYLYVKMIYVYVYVCVCVHAHVHMHTHTPLCQVLQRNILLIYFYIIVVFHGGWEEAVYGHTLEMQERTRYWLYLLYCLSFSHIFIHTFPLTNSPYSFLFSLVTLNLLLLLLPISFIHRCTHLITILLLIYLLIYSCLSLFSPPYHFLLSIHSPIIPLSILSITQSFILFSFLFYLASWNWRIKIPIELPLKTREMGRLRVQMWERNITRYVMIIITLLNI